jgi:hypothetical protein
LVLASYEVRGVGSTEEELDLTYRNMAVFSRALEAVGKYRTPRCCGC